MAGKQTCQQCLAGGVKYWGGPCTLHSDAAASGHSGGCIEAVFPDRDDTKNGRMDRQGQGNLVGVSGERLGGAVGKVTSSSASGPEGALVWAMLTRHCMDVVVPRDSQGACEAVPGCSFMSSSPSQGHGHSSVPTHNLPSTWSGGSLWVSSSSSSLRLPLHHFTLTCMHVCSHTF